MMLLMLTGLVPMLVIGSCALIIAYPVSTRAAQIGFCLNLIATLFCLGLLASAW